MKNSKKLAFIGAGKMAEALISGICENNIFRPSNIMVSDKLASRRKYLQTKYGVKAAEANHSAVAFANIIILAVKPQDMPEVLKEIKFYTTRFQFIISIAAGITLETLQIAFKKSPLIRAMPNNPAMAGAGVTALAAGSFATESHLKEADHIFKTVGETIFIPEKLMNIVTALSGSGPAFVYLFLEGLINGAAAGKLPHATAQKLAVKTLAGAALTFEKTGLPLSKLREMVTSKGGTTEAGLKVLKKYKFEKAVQESILAAAKRSRELSR